MDDEGAGGVGGAAPDPAIRHLFVYGSLRGGAGHPMHAVLARGGERVGAGRVPGILLDWGPYPAAVTPDGEGRWVVGEVYRLDDARGVLPLLDRYEGCGSGGESALGYERRAVEVRLEGGDTVEAWVYWYVGEVEGAREVPSGDWLRR